MPATILKHTSIPLIVLIAITSGNLVRTHGLADIRAVVAIQILALGMLAGALIAKLVMQRKMGA